MRSHTAAPIARSLYTVGMTLPANDQLRIAAHYRFEREWQRADFSTTKLARRWKVTVRQAQRIVVLYRGAQR